MFNIFSRRKRNIILKSPFDGKVVPLDDVPDEVFSGRMVGGGIAIEPESNFLLAPVDGILVQLFPTQHAVGIRTKEGLEVLIHLGIDSVKLKGKGFTSLVKVDQKVFQGDKLIKIDWPLISNDIVSTISPLVITNMEMVKEIKILTKGFISKGDDLLMVGI